MRISQSCNVRNYGLLFVPGEVISCLENAENLQSVDLNELSVTLDIFVLTLPLEIEAMPPDFCHNR